MCRWDALFSRFHAGEQQGEALVGIDVVSVAKGRKVKAGDDALPHLWEPQRFLAKLLFPPAA